MVEVTERVINKSILGHRNEYLCDHPLITKIITKLLNLLPPLYLTYLFNNYKF